jgi:hypothetical protein
VHMENLSYPNTLKDIKLLVVSYSNMKPMSAEVHQYLAAWVKKGGVLVYCGSDQDPYQTVQEWWNKKPWHFKAPSQHLFRLLNIRPGTGDQQFKVGKGAVYILRNDPKEFVMTKEGSAAFVKAVKEGYEKDAHAGTLQLKNSLFLERGPYDIVSVMDESINNEPYLVHGPLIDLFDPQLPILGEKTVQPGQQALLFNLARITHKEKPQVLASASRIYDEKIMGQEYSFVSKSPVNTTNSMRILLPQAPAVTILTDANGQQLKEVVIKWDETSHTLFLGFENDPRGTSVQIKW